MVRTYLESCEIAGKTVCEDLEREGYAVTVFNFEAAAVGAPHRRDRVFFVGYAEHNGIIYRKRSVEAILKMQESKEGEADHQLRNKYRQK